MTWGPEEPDEISVETLEEERDFWLPIPGKSTSIQLAALIITFFAIGVVGFVRSQLSSLCFELPFLAMDSCRAAVLLGSFALVLGYVCWERIRGALVFVYVCFLKEISGKDHSERLESFYKSQAEVYDATRMKLLAGRKDMLRLCAAQLNEQAAKLVDQNHPRELVWVDIGGGTGWNVEQMNDFFPVSKFRKVYIVDLCKSLCETAEKRFKALGWKNVEVLCADATTFTLPAEFNGASLVTMSYSLSMIPDLYGVVDNAHALLADDGIFGIVDFGVSSKIDADYRKHSWLSRWFWQLWFDFDYITLHHSRRQYVEYRFNTLKDFTGWNYFVLRVPIPFYILLATKQQSAGSQWRQTYDDSKRNPWDTYMYAFAWEDPDVDMEELDLQPSDRMLAITSGGCNLLTYLVNGISHVHAVDMNACQNHLFELKLAALRSPTIDYAKFWSLFGEGLVKDFSEVLDLHLSPYLSAPAYRFWKERVHYFEKTSLYYTGHSGSGLRLVQMLGTVFGIHKAVDVFCNSKSVLETQRLWQSSIRPTLFPSWLVNVVFKRSKFMWGALGVPKKQMKMLLGEYDGDLQQCIRDTFEPIAKKGIMTGKNYFYYCGLMGKYHPECCPTYLTPESYEQLSGGEGKLLENVRIHTQKFIDVLKEHTEEKEQYSKVILMDHMDWFNETQAREEIEALWNGVRSGGKVFWRSAERLPWYNKCFEEQGFKVRQINVRKGEEYLDRVNMYLSFNCAIRP